MGRGKGVHKMGAVFTYAENTRVNLKAPIRFLSVQDCRTRQLIILFILESFQIKLGVSCSATQMSTIDLNIIELKAPRSYKN